MAGADPPHDFTTGGGKVGRTLGSGSDSITIEEKFAFSAHDEDDSSSTTVARNGHYVYQRTITSSEGTILDERDLKGSVDCVRVSGNQAAFSGPIEKSSSDPALEGRQAFFLVEDNDSIDTPDEFRFIGFSGPPPNGSPTSSSTPPSCFFDRETFPITSGNFLVSDAP